MKQRPQSLARVAAVAIVVVPIVCAFAVCVAALVFVVSRFDYGHSNLAVVFLYGVLVGALLSGGKE